MTNSEDTTLRIGVEEFSDELELIRRDAYRLSFSSFDEFDRASAFIVARVNDKAVGTVRLSSYPASPHSKWCDEPWPLPVGPEIVELTRGVVASKFRGQGLYRAMMTRCIHECRRRTFAFATAAVEPEFKYRGFLADCGFQNVGQPITFTDFQRLWVLQPIMCNLRLT
jgi:predicted GNAT family N-acyltransferase